MTRKKYCILLCVLFVAILSFSVSAADNLDINQDSVVNAEDALVVLKSAAKLIDLDYDKSMLADTNNDGVINAEDALAILEVVAKNIVRIKEPLPGTDEKTMFMHVSGSNVLMFESYYNDLLIQKQENDSDKLWTEYADTIEKIYVHTDKKATIEANAFDDFKNLKEIRFYCNELNIDENAINIENKAQITVYGFSDSVEQAFAYKNGMNFVAFDCTQTKRIPGTDVYWTYDAETQELRIHGEGEIGAYFYSDTPEFGLAIDRRTPWSMVEDKVETLIIGEGITKIGALAFVELYDLKRAYIPEHVVMQRAHPYLNSDGIGYYDILPDVQQYHTDSRVLYCAPGSSAEEYAKAENFPYITKDVDVLYAEENGFEYVVFADKTVEITGYTGKESVIRIPEKLGGCDVTSIGRRAFIRNYLIEEVVIGENITTIGFEAFCNCKSLRKATIKGNVEWPLEQQAYSGCAPHLSNGVFAYCYALNEINLGDELSSIPAGFSYGCTSMQKIKVPASVVEIGINALGDWKTLNHDPDDIGGASHGTSDGAIIEGYTGSAAEEYANTNRITFVVIE